MDTPPSHLLRILVLTLEYAEPWIFSGNGVYSRSFVHNLTKFGNCTVLVICGRPAGQRVTTNNKLLLNDDSTIREGSKVEVRTVSLPIWFKLDRNSSWREYGEGVNRFTKDVLEFHPDIVLGVDWTSKLAWETLKRSAAGKLSRIPYIFLCFRVFSSSPGLSQEDKMFYSQREAETIQAAVRTVALSKCDASTLNSLKTMTLPRGFIENKEGNTLNNNHHYYNNIQVISPCLRDDVRNASLKLTRSIVNPRKSSRRKWYWSHSTLADDMTLVTLESSSGSTTTQRNLITCVCRISPEKEVLRFVDIVERISSFLKENEIIPYLVGTPTDEEYSRRVYQRLKRAFPGDSSIIVSDFVPADKLQTIFSKTLLNIHPARREPFGMSITEAAAFGVPTLLDGSGFVGATDILSFHDSCSICCDMKSISQSSAVLKSILRRRSFLELIGRRAQNTVLAWGSHEWAQHVREELLDDVLRNSFRAYEYDPQDSQEKAAQLLSNRMNNNNTDEETDETWPWLPLTEWIVTQLPDQNEGIVYEFDLEGVRLVAEQLLKLSPSSLSSLIQTNRCPSVRQDMTTLLFSFIIRKLTTTTTTKEIPQMTPDMYEWAWYLLMKNPTTIGPARFRLVPSKISEDSFWWIFFGIIREGVIRLVVNSKNKEKESSSPVFFPVFDENDEIATKEQEHISGNGNSINTIEDKIQWMERLVQRDENGRGIAPICTFVGKGKLEEAARNVLDSNRVLILTGFPCVENAPSPQETDGPPGAIALAKCCAALGKRVLMIIEEPNASVLRACIACNFTKSRSLLLRASEATKIESFGSKGQITFEIFPPKKEFREIHHQRMKDILNELDSDHGHMIAIERAGPGNDGKCRTMKGRVMEDHLLAPLHILFQNAKFKSGIRTTGIGDGGNEVGMGFALEVVEKVIGEDIACHVKADCLIPCSVSNWGGHALCAALALLVLEKKTIFHGPDRVQKAADACLGTDELLENTIKACVDAGACDGISGKQQLSVDGLPFAKTLEIIQGLRSQILSFTDNNM